jgi:hypothetical protein
MCLILIDAWMYSVHPYPHAMNGTTVHLPLVPIHLLASCNHHNTLDRRPLKISEHCFIFTSYVYMDYIHRNDAYLGKRLFIMAFIPRNALI